MNLTFECKDQKELDELFILTCRPEENPESGLYVCCPMLNVSCNKRSCAFMGNGSCYLTTKKEYAAQEEHIRPLSYLAHENKDCFDHIPKILRYVPDN